MILRAGTVLVLGGTGEGRELATALVASELPVISSLAGRVAAPRLPPGEVRSGGFGGIDGLAGFLTEKRIAAVVDVTHPFAARITAHAAAACARTDTPLLVLRRPPWIAVEGDEWTTVPDLPAAAGLVRATDPETAVLLSTGRQGVGAFAGAPQRFWLRAVDPPDEPMPAGCQLILDRGPFTLEHERTLLRELGIGLLVTKNSGGPMTAAKLTAARELALPVIVVERPELPPGVEVVRDVPAALAWIGAAKSIKVWD